MNIINATDVSASAGQTGTAAGAPGRGHTLAFLDEFDGGSAYEFEDIWKTVYHWGDHWLPGNAELQYYVDVSDNPHGAQAHRIEDGVLTLVAEPIPAAAQALFADQSYTSGLVTTQTSFAQQYGYFEMRAQLPAGQGLWPAFWLLPIDGSWPPELDVVEVLGHETDVIHATVHTKETGKHRMKHSAIPVDDVSAGFHTYGVDWNRDTITWYFDGVEVFEAPTPDDMHGPMYLLANLAVGGYWPGKPDATTPFPAEMRIDYIAAWAPPADRAAVSVPEAWAAIDAATAFSEVSAEGAVRSSAHSSRLADGETALQLTGDWARIGLGNDLDNFVGGSDAEYNKLYGKGGDDVLLGGGGTDEFVVSDGDGNDRILDFSNEPGNADKVRLKGFHFEHFDDVLPWMVETAEGTILRLDEDQALLFEGVGIASFSADQFVFVDPVPPPPGALPLPATPAAGNTPPSGTFMISGDAAPGATLTAVASGLSDPDGVGALAHSWLRDGTPIPGATGPTYTLTADDVGARIAVEFSYLDGGGTTERVTSLLELPVTGEPAPATDAAGPLPGGGGVPVGGGGSPSGQGAPRERHESLPLADDELRDLVEIYVALFDRPPDAAGLAFYSGILAAGTSLAEAAATFRASAEYAAIYPPGIGDGDFVTAMYDNVFGRAPDAPGLAFWLDALESGLLTRDAFLLDFLDGARPDASSDTDADRDGRAPGAARGEAGGEAGGVAGGVAGSDAAYLDARIDIALHFALTKGWAEPAAGRAALALYDGSDAGFDAAMDAIGALPAAWPADATDDAPVAIVGLMDDPSPV